jgi:predicted nucleotidyltransferase
LAKKPLPRSERLSITYSEEHWNLLSSLRKQAEEIMDGLAERHIFAVVHGSIARGDVTHKSDIDVFIPQIISSFAIERALEDTDIRLSRRVLVQATPTYSVKGYIEIDEQKTVSFPLSRMRGTEREFYRFGGEATLETLRNDIRIVGVDKRLMLIEPTPRVARMLKISIDTVLDRTHALMRRDKVGRTGRFIERELMPEETFESVLKKLSDRKPEVRRRLRTV